MRLIVNKKERNHDGKPALSALLADLEVNPAAVAVAVNGELVPRHTWEEPMLKEGSVIEIVHIVAGGSGPVDVGTPGDSGAPLVIAGRTFRSRLFLGTGKYASPEVMVEALDRSGTEMVTVAIRYMDLEGGGRGAILPHLDLKHYALLPNTAGATTAEQAIRMAHLAREATGTNWIKLEVIGDPVTLWPDVPATVEATRRLVRDGFVVLPYTSPDLVGALRLEEAGASTVMPLASLIGSGQGLIDWHSIRRIKERVKVPVVVDAGLGSPADTALAMELGADAVLINTAIARAQNPPLMAEAMRWAVVAGRMGFLAGRMPRLAEAAPSSPTSGVIQVAPPELKTTA